MRFPEFILKNVLRRKSRSLLTVAGLSTAASATMLLLSVSWGYAGSAMTYFDSRGVDIVVVRAGVAERITSSLSADMAERLRALPDVSLVDGSLSEMASFGENSLIGIPVRGLDPAGFSLAHYEVIQGNTLNSGAAHSGTNRQSDYFSGKVQRPTEAGDLPGAAAPLWPAVLPPGVLLGESLAKSLKKTAGDRVSIDDVPFQVAGIFRTGDALESNSAVVLLSDLQNMMDRPAQVSEFQIRLKPTAGEDAARRLCEAIEKLNDPHGASLGFKAMLTRDFVSSDTETGLLTGMAWGVSVIAVGLSTLGVLNTMLMSVFERTRELGILRAIGWSRGQLVQLIVGESLLLSAAGVVFGIAVAWSGLHTLAAWSFTRTLVQPGLVPAAVAAGAAVAVLAGCAGAIYPAHRATKVTPIEALHHE